MAYVAYRDNGNSVLRRHRGQERIVLNASDNADLGWGLDFSDKLCHQYSVSESPVARYASLDRGLLFPSGFGYRIYL